MPRLSLALASPDGGQPTRVALDFADASDCCRELQRVVQAQRAGRAAMTLYEHGVPVITFDPRQVVSVAIAGDLADMAAPYDAKARAAGDDA